MVDQYKTYIMGFGQVLPFAKQIKSWGVKCVFILVNILVGFHQAYGQRQVNYKSHSYFYKEIGISTPKIYETGTITICDSLMKVVIDPDVTHDSTVINLSFYSDYDMDNIQMKDMQGNIIFFNSKLLLISLKTKNHHYNLELQR